MMLKNNIIIKVNKENYKYVMKYSNNINTAVIRIFTDYKYHESVEKCGSPQKKVSNCCGDDVPELLTSLQVRYLDYSNIANDVFKKELTFVFDKKILELKPARYISSLIINNICCQEIIIDTFSPCPKILDITQNLTTGSDEC